MLNQLADDESHSASWISLSDLFMVAMVLFAASTVTLTSVNKELASHLQKEVTHREDAERDAALAKSALAMRQKEIDMLNSALANATATILSLKESIEQLNEAETERQQTATELIQTRHQLAEAMSRLQILNRQLEEYQKQLQELSGKTNDLPRKLRELENSLKAATGKLESLQAELAAAKLRIKELQNTLASTTLERSFRQELLGIRSLDNQLDRVIFIVDRSGSMTRSSNNSKGTRWEYVCDEIQKWLTMLPLANAQLILFNNKVDVFPAPGSFISINGGDAVVTRGAQELLTILRNTTPDNGTNTAEALRQAFRTTDVDAIFLFTDGVPMIKAEVNTTSADYKALQDEVLKLIDEHKSRTNGPPINVIGLGDYFSTRLSGPDQVHMAFGVFLMEVAQRSGGTFIGR